MSTLRSPTVVSAPLTSTFSAPDGTRTYHIPPSTIPTIRLTRPSTNYPVVVGHEIVGKAVRVGSQIKHIKVGDRVGVGAQSGSCANQKGDCEACADG